MEFYVSEGEVQHVSVLSHTIETEYTQSYVQYTLLVRGSTPYMHSMARFDRNKCLLDEPSFHIKRRYSQLLKMHLRLVHEFPNVQLPEFPPKRWLLNTSDAVIEERKKGLNRYFRELLSVQKLRTAKTLVKVIFQAIRCKIAVVGYSSIGKSSLVDAFCLVQPTHRHARIELTLNSSQLMTARGPIDIITDNSLVRISCIHTHTIRPRTDLNVTTQELDSYDAILLVYSMKFPRSLEIAENLKHLIDHQATSMISLGGGEGRSPVVESPDYEEEVYNVFELLARKAVARFISKNAW